MRTSNSGYRQVIINWQRRTGGRLAGADNAMAESYTLLLLRSNPRNSTQVALR